MFLLQYDVTPAGDHPEIKGRAGIASCWSAGAVVADAEHDALQLIHEAGWLVRARRFVRTVERTSYAERDEGLRYYDQATTDGTVLVIHTYPTVQPDSGEKA